MRAAVRHEFGPPEVLRVEEVPTPEPGDREVRIRVRAASVNLGDWELLTGEPRWITVLATMFARWPKHPVPPPPGAGKGRGPFAPKFKILGTDLAGVVDAVGKGVTRFRPGDELFGDCSPAGFGAFAEYVCVPETAPLVPKPAGMTFAQAAALPQAGFIAVQAIRDEGRVGPGARVLINGAGGGTGTLAVQLAKHYGAEVTGVDGPDKLEMLRSIGADHAIDYTRDDFTESGERYDVILDMAARRSIFRVRRSLTPDGVYLLGGGAGVPTLQAALLGPLTSLAGNGRVKFHVAASRPEDLAYLTEQFEAGTVAPVIDACFALEETAEALRRVGEKRSLGKVVVTP